MVPNVSVGRASDDGDPSREVWEAIADGFLSHKVRESLSLFCGIGPMLLKFSRFQFVSGFSSFC